MGTHHTTATMATRVAKAAAVDWQRITSSLGLQKDTLQALRAFRKRHGDAKVAHQQVKDLKADVDFAHYKNVLKNQEVVSQLEQTWKGFKPADYDVNAQLKAIDAFQGKAVEGATKAAQKVEQELGNLDATLKDIESARPFDQLTTGDVARARPSSPRQSRRWSRTANGPYQDTTRSTAHSPPSSLFFCRCVVFLRFRLCLRRWSSMQTQTSPNQSINCAH